MILLLFFVNFVGYLAVGFVSGRRTFVREMGDSKRLYSPYQDGTYLRRTSAFTKAVRWSIFMVLVWPVVGPFYLMMKETPHERLEQQKEETAALEARLEELSRQAQSVLKRTEHL